MSVALNPRALKGMIELRRRCRICTENLAAYTLYLQGRQQWNSRTEEGLGRSVDLFQQAIELDPDYARAYAGLADALTISADWGHLPALDAFERGREAAETAVRIDPDLAE